MQLGTALLVKERRWNQRALQADVRPASTLHSAGMQSLHDAALMLISLCSVLLSVVGQLKVHVSGVSPFHANCAI